MKKIYTTVFAVLIATAGVFAQKQHSGTIDIDRPEVNEMITSRVVNDTLWPGDFGTGTPTLYGSSNGGFVCGNNGYGDLGKGQEFAISNSMMLEGVMLFFGAKTDAGGSMTVEALDMDGTTGTTSAGTGDQPCPGTSLASETLSVADADTAGFTVVNFTPVSVSSNFYVGIEMSGFNGDTVGLISSTADDTQGEKTWEKWSDGTWYTMGPAWGLNFDLAIWALVDNPDAASIEDQSYFNGIKAFVQPNPVNEVANIVLEFAQRSDVMIDIVSANGQRVYSDQLGDFAQGRHNIQIPVSELAPGLYYYSVAANGQRLTQKMMVK